VPDDGGSLSGCRYVQPSIVSFGAASLRGEITLEVGGAVTQDSPLADFLRHRSHSSFRSHGQFPTPMHTLKLCAGVIPSDVDFIGKRPLKPT
jgi:hypothetical protein